MATLQQIRDAVNARLAIFWPKFKTRQETYRANHGIYWQGIPFSSVPDDGALVSPDFTKAPADRFTPPVYDENGVLVTPAQPHSWAWAGVNADLPATVEAQMRCDVYTAPGPVQGYFLTCRVSKDGVIYERVAHVRDGVEISTGDWAVA